MKLSDMLFANAMMGEGGGGGGGSDFSTAQVTFINNSTSDGMRIICATVYDDDVEDLHASSTGLYADVGGSDTQNVVLYKGMAWGYPDYVGNINFSVTGSIELDGFNNFNITGNGTITATDK